MQIYTLGIDIAKSIFQLHGVDETGKTILKKKLRRGEFLTFIAKLTPCLIGMEACATSHYWSRKLSQLGHNVRLIPPAYVKPYVKRQKNDAADAEAICEAVARPNMTFVPAKTQEQQSIMMLHRARDILMRQRTMLLNAVRAHFAEFGIISPQGARYTLQHLEAVANGEVIGELPEIAMHALIALGNQINGLQKEISNIETQLKAWHKSSEESQRLETIPGIGLISATALATSVPDATCFQSARQFAAWLGLVPKQNSSGGKERLGHITKMGNQYLRRLLVIGATSVMWHCSKQETQTALWVNKLKENKPHRLVSVALANKTARVVWAMLKSGESYKAV